MDELELLRSMLLIRAFESALMGRSDHGFQLLSRGGEAVAVGLCAALAPADQLLSSGRSIGPALARGLAPRAVMAELLGKTTGPCRGKGGRGHLAQPDLGFFGAHAVVGGNLAVAAGVALAMQTCGTGIVACMFGDGACGAGALHETLNVAALWNLPLLFVCDNNQYAVATPRSHALAPRQLSDLAQPFGIPGMTIDGMDVIAVREAALAFAQRARAGYGPAFLECVTDRLAPHSTATRETRSAAEMRAAHARCPIRRLTARLAEHGRLAPEAQARLEHEAAEIAAQALRFADAGSFPILADAVSDVA